MLYKYEGEFLLSFDVDINYNKLKKVREDIIENCSVIKKCEGVFSDEYFYKKNKQNRKNFFKKELDHVEKNHWCPDIYYYKYEYDEYCLPEIINVIDDILNGNEERINDLFSTEDIKFDINDYRDNKALSDVINLINDYKITNNEISINRAKYILRNFNHIKLEDKQKSVKDYYPELIKCFSFTKKSSISNLEFEKLKSFLGDEWIEKMTNFFDYQENSEKLVTNQYVKKLMK